MDKFPRGRTAVVGAATYGIGECPGLTPLDLATRAALKALADANLKLSDVDGLFLATPDDPLSTLAGAEYLGIRPKLVDNNRTGGSAFLNHAIYAALALEAGYIDCALVMYGSNQRSGAGGLVSMRQMPIYDRPFKPMNPMSSYALAAARHMHVYGTTREQLAAVAVAARGWANLNPEAFMYQKGELTIEDCLKARMVSDPLTVRDACLITDGAAAVVMTRSDRARDIVTKPVYLLGGAGEITHSDISSMPDMTVTGAERSGKRAYAQAGLKPSDIDVLAVYDAFTINTILFLEDLGFCPKGEGGRFVEGGRIAPGGELPVNTNGGGLSCVHPGMYGLFTMVEAVQQLRGECGARQVKGAEIALSHGNGGTLSSQTTLLWGNAASV